MAKTIRVRMAPGLTMPLPSGVGIDTTVEVMTSETEVEVLRDSRFIRRRLACGDLVEVTQPAPEPAKRAAAPKAEE